MLTRLLVTALILIAAVPAFAQELPADIAPIQLENAADLALLAEYPGPTAEANNVVSQFAVSPDGTRIAMPGQLPGLGDAQDGAIFVRDLASGETEEFRFEPGEMITIVGFVGSDRLAYLSNTSDYNILDLSTGAVESSTPLPPDMYGVFDLAVSETIGLAALPLQNYDIGLFSLKDGELVNTVYADPEVLGFYAFAFSPDGRLLAAGDSDGYVWIWDTETAQLIHRTYAPTQSTSFAIITALAFSPDGETLAIGSDMLSLWTLPPEGAYSNEFTILEGHTGNVTDLAFTADGDVLVSMSGAIENSDVSLRAWDVAAQEALYVYEDEEFGDLSAFVLTPDDRLIAALDFDGALMLFGAEG